MIICDSVVRVVPKHCGRETRQNAFVVERNDEICKKVLLILVPIST